MADMQDVKKYLEQLLDIDLDIQSKVTTAQRMRESLTTISATRYKVDNVQESNTHTTEDKMAEYMDMEKEADKMVDDLLDLKMNVIKEINKIDDRLHVIILTERYVNNKGWKEVAAIFGKEERQIHRNHGSALQEFYEHNKKEVDKYIDKPKIAVQKTVNDSE